MLEVTDLRRTYTTNERVVRALDGVSLSIMQGDFVAIRGPSGSGKSTLMNVLGLLDRPDSGRYSLEGADISSLDANALATLRNERIGFVFQSFHLMPRATAIENVELPLVYSRKQAPSGLGLLALQRVGLADRASHLPGQLLGGQQQRVAIARALVQTPSLLLADEPTGNLDSKSSGEVLDLFAELNRGGATIVMITHDHEVARRARRLIEFSDGCIVADTATQAPHPTPSGAHPS